MALDVGLGTQDILVGKNPDENSTKFVLPSPIRIAKNKVDRASGDLFLSGYTMGGGPLSRSIIDHAKNNEVVMTKKSARTISDDLEEVRGYGIEIIDEAKFNLDGYEEIFLSDLISFPHIRDLLEENDIDLPRNIGVAVQDHGVAPSDLSDRKYRFQFFKKAIRDGDGFMDLIYDEKTGRFSRIDSCFDYLDERGFNPHLMDSKIASIFGCIGDDDRLIVDAGNGHFIAATCRSKELIGLFEHHSSQLNESKIKFFLSKLKDGSLSDEEVFEDGGHGAYVKHELDPEKVLVTGPKRGLMPDDIEYELAHPIGDVMMTGAFGLYKGVSYFESN